MAENPYIGRIGASKAPVITTPDPTPVSAPVDDGAPTMPAAVSAGQEAPPTANPYEAFLAPKPPTRAVLDAASRTDADAFARSRQLSAETGMPADVIERNMEEVTRRQAVAQADEALAGAPATKRWLDSNPDNVKLSHDVVKQLTATEALVGVLRSTVAGPINVVGGSISGIGEMYNISGRAIARPVLSALEALGLKEVAEGLNQPAPAWMRPGDALQAVGEPIKDFGKVVDVKPEDRTFVNEVAGGVGQVAAQIVIQVLTGGVGTLAAMFGQGVDAVTEDVKKEGKQGTVAGDSAAILGGTITGITEKYGLDMLLKHIPASTRSWIGRILAGAGTEGAQEIVEKALNDITAIVLYDHDRKIFDADTLYEGGVGGAVGAIVSAAIPGKKAIKARKDLERVVEDIEKSPLNQRAPDKAAEHFAAAMEEQGVETFVSAQKLAENAKPELLAELGLADKIDAAIERGGDVQISGEAFYRLANEGVMANLLDDVRVGRDAMTSKEAEAVPDDLAQQRQLERDMEAQAQAEKDAAAPRLSLFHGSKNGEIVKFDRARADDDALFGPGVYLTEDPEVAKGYAETKAPNRSNAEVHDTATLREFYKVGEIISDSSGRSKVLAFDAKEDGGWSVQVVEIGDDGNVKPGARPRTHSTAPSRSNVDATLRERAGGTSPEAAVGEYEVDVKNAFDLDTPVPQEAATKILRHLADNGVVTDAEAYEAGRKVVGGTGRDLYSAVSAAMQRAGETPDKAAINAAIEAAGFDAIKHTGGVGGDRTHQVWIVLDPSKVALKKPTAPAEATTEAEWKASQWQRRQLIAGGFNQQEIDGMSQKDVLDLVGEKPPSPDKWHGQADEPVALAEEQMGFQAMFATAREAGMTDQQYASYLVAIAEAGEGARKRSEARAIKRQQRQLTAEWNAEREVVRQQVEQSVRQEPVYAALDSLGVDRMDRNAIVEIMDQESILDILPKSGGRQIFAAKGIHPDVLANQYGFDTGKELIDAIMASVPLKDKIEAETDARMSEKHGAILDKKRDLQEALEDLHSDDQAKILTAELNALRGADKKGALKPELFRRTAKAAMDRLQVKEIHPKLFLDEEVRKGKLAGKLIRGKGKVDGQKLSGSNRAAAAAAKFQQLLNFEYARQAFTIRKDVETARKQLERLADPSNKIPGIDADFRDRILAELEGFDFSRTRPRGGALIGDIHYSNMSLGAFNTLYERVKQIETEGRKWKELLIEGQKRDFEEAKQALIEQTATMPTLDRVARKATGDEKFFDGARKVLAGLGTYVAKIELILQRLDGGKVAGIWHKTIFQPLANAQTAELDLYERTMKGLVEGVAGLPKETRKKLARKEMIPSLGRKMDTSELLMLALNAGNASNMQKVIEGSAKIDGGQQWTEQGVLDALAKLGPEEAKWVQKVWDAFETIRPQVEEVYRSVHGIAPERVQPREIEIGGVKLKGGYFPMLYDRDAQPAPIPGGQSVMDMLENQYEKASVFSGMTKSRSEDYSAPVLLDFSQLAHALRQPIHFVTHFEAVRNVNRILNDKEINSAIVAKLGPETRDEFQRWLGAVATNNADRSGSSIVNRVFQEIRTNATVAVLGLSYTTAVSQVFGLSTSVAALGKRDDGTFAAREGSKWMAVGLARYLANPKEAIQNVIALSGEMRHRLGNSDRDMSQTLGSLSGKVSAFRVMQRASLKAIGAIQLGTVDMPTWLGAYNKALSQDKSEQEAVDYADAIVRTSQASGHTKDLAALQRQKGVSQLLTMFTTYTTLLYGLIGQTVGDGKRDPKKIPGAVSRLVWLLAVPAVADAFLRQEGPPDDEDDEQAKAAWWGLKIGTYAAKSIPLVGQIAGSVAEGYSASLSPVENILGSKIPAALKSAYKLVQEDEELEIADARKIVDAVGLTIGMPGTTQVVRAMKALENDDAELYDFLVTPKKN